MNTYTREAILSTVEVRFQPDGRYSACSHASWILNEMEEATQIRIFKRGEHRIKFVIYGAYIDDIDTFGTRLCAALIDRDETVWRRVELRDCDR